MRFFPIIALTIILITSRAACSTNELVDFFIARKTGESESVWNEDAFFDNAFRSKELFFKAIRVLSRDNMERLFIGAFFPGKANFVGDLSFTDVRCLHERFFTLRPFDNFISLLDTPIARQAALNFFTQHPEIIRDHPSYHKMLMLLFCKCQKPQNQLTEATILHIIQDMKNSHVELMSLVKIFLNMNMSLGIQFCLNLLHYSALVLETADSFLVETVTSALETRLGAFPDGSLEQFQIYSSENWFDMFIPYFSNCGNACLQEAINFILHCDPVYARNVIKRMMDVCKDREMWSTFEFLMQQLPQNIHYDCIKSLTVPLKTLSILSSRYASLHNLYFLSRFSRFPAQHVRAYVLSLVPALEEYEPNNTTIQAWTGECTLPMEILLVILVRSDPVTQLLTVPLVCKAWAGVRKELLEKSPVIHALFLSDITRCRFHQLRSHLPWMSIFKSTNQVVEYFARIATTTGAITTYQEHYSEICSQYIKNLWTPELDQQPNAVEHYAMEYARLVACINGPIISRPLLYHPASMTLERYGNVITKLFQEYQVVPRIPWDVLRDRLVELCDAINDKEIVEKILEILEIQIGYPNFDIICANILVQRMDIPRRLVPILSSGVSIFKRLFVGNASLPLTLDTLGQNPNLITDILYQVSLGFQMRAYELLVHTLCHLQGDHARINAITTALKLYQERYLSTYPLLYILNNPQQFSTEQFKLVQRVVLESGLCRAVELELLPIACVFPDF